MIKQMVKIDIILDLWIKRRMHRRSQHMEITKRQRNLGQVIQTIISL